jgi:hypothetical protein
MNVNEKQRKQKVRIKQPRKSFDLSELGKSQVQLGPSAIRYQNDIDMETNI